MLSKVADVVSGMKSEKCPIFQDYSIQFFGKKKYKLFRNLHCPNTFRIQQADENCLRQNDAISGSDGMERRDRLPSWERCVLVYFRLKLDRVLFT